MYRSAIACALACQLNIDVIEDVCCFHHLTAFPTLVSGFSCHRFDHRYVTVCCLQDDRIILQRNKSLNAALRMARMNNVSIGHWLVNLGVVRRVDVPDDLVDGPVFAALNRVQSRLRRAKARREEVHREIRKQRDFVLMMERTEWGKMSRWERRRNW